MCGRFYLTATPAEIRKQSKIQRVPALMPRYNIVPRAKIGAMSLAKGLSEIRVYDWLQMGNIAHIG